MTLEIAVAEFLPLGLGADVSVCTPLRGALPSLRIPARVAWVRGTARPEDAGGDRGYLLGVVFLEHIEDWTAPAPPSIPRLLWVGPADAGAADIQRFVSPWCEVTCVETGTQALAVLNGERSTFVLLARDPPDMSRLEFLTRAARPVKEREVGFILLLREGEAPTASGCTDAPDPLLFARQSLHRNELLSALEQVGRAWQEGSTPFGRVFRVLDWTDRLTVKITASEVGALLTEAITRGVGADRAQVLVPDETGLWLYPLGAAARSDGRSSLTGVLGYVARARRPYHAARLNGDPRHHPGLDELEDDAGARLLAQPVLSLKGTLLGILVAVRDHSRPDFNAEERQALSLLGQQGLSALSHVLLHRGAAVAPPPAPTAAEGATGIFRQQALLKREFGAFNPGSPLRISPRLEWSYWLLLALLAVGSLYSAFGTVVEYAAGPAVVRTVERVEITATSPSTIVVVDAQPGQHVGAEQALVQMNDREQVAELQRVSEELDVQLVKLLQEGPSPSAREAVMRLRAERALAQKRVDERTIRAPRAGVVSDIRIRPGMHLTPGEQILTLVPDEARLSITALLPGQFRPFLHEGTPLLFEASGFQNVHHTLPVESVADEVIGPSEARRFLGPEVADSVSPSEPVVIVRATLSSRRFLVADRELSLYDGMLGQVKVPVRTERIIFALLPGLRVIFSRSSAPQAPHETAE